MLVVAVQSALSCRRFKPVKRPAQRPVQEAGDRSGRSAGTNAGCGHHHCRDGAPDGRRAGRERWRAIARNIFPFVVVGTIWEIVAWAGVFPHRLFPTLEEVALSFLQLTVAGILPHHAIETVIRLLSGFALAAVVRRDHRRADGALAPGRGHLPAAGDRSARRSPASPIRRCSCSGSASAISRRCCWSASCRRFRSSSTAGPA